MPFASEAQRRYLWSKKPAVARRFSAHSGVSKEDDDVVVPKTVQDHYRRMNPDDYEAKIEEAKVYYRKLREERRAEMAEMRKPQQIEPPMPKPTENQRAKIREHAVKKRRHRSKKPRIIVPGGQGSDKPALGPKPQPAARIVPPPQAPSSPVQKAAGGGLMLSDGSWRRDSGKRPKKRARSRAADDEYVRRQFDATPFVEPVPKNPQHRSNDPSQAELDHRDAVARKQVQARDEEYRKRQKRLRSKGLQPKPMTRGTTGKRINSPWGDAQGNTLLKKSLVVASRT